MWGRQAKWSARVGAALSLASACAAGAPAEAPSLRFIAPTNHAMPIAGFQNGKLTDGVLKDLGELIAARLGRSAQFVLLPSKRVTVALTEGEADALCYVMPQWVDGDFHWTKPFISEAQVVVAGADTPALRALSDLSEQLVGTVIAYRYPVLGAALGSHFRRTDVPDMQNNLRRLAAGRVNYAIAERGALAYYLRQHPDARLSVAWQVERYDASCAFSRKSKVSADDLDRVIDRLVSDGSIERLLARYR